MDADSAPQDTLETSDNDVDLSSDAKAFILLLISMYRESPELWNKNKIMYIEKGARNVALNRITDNLKYYDKDFTVEKLKRKINTLRTNFNREHNKVKQNILSGNPTYKPRLWYYNEMLFIIDPMDIEKMTAEMESSTERNVKLEENPTPNTTRKKRKRHENRGPLPLPTSYDIIAKSWIMKLRRLTPVQRRFAEKIINDVLFEGEMETLTREGVIFK